MTGRCTIKRGVVVPCAGFKLDTLLKLADVKGVDRKTSLLHFVLDQLLKESATLASLSAQLRFVRPAANLQVLTPHPPCFAACHASVCFSDMLQDNVEQKQFLCCMLLAQESHHLLSQLLKED